MSGNIERVLSTVSSRVNPSAHRRAQIEALARNLEKKVVSSSEAFGVDARVRVEGSVAKDTWLGEEPDIDIFMRVPRSIPRKSLGEVCLKVAKKATEGSVQIERFAEHPYLEAIVEGTRVNIVPCYRTKLGEWLSATDRTPFHTDYMNEHLNERMRGEVRLLKRFMKGVEVYGAEIKVGGFSGYLCELMILHYGSFLKTLGAFARYRQRVVVDIEQYYKNREKEVDLLFNEPLVIVDPVDKARNVASAVRHQKLYAFVAAARAFLKAGTLEFFYPREIEPLPIQDLKDRLARRGSTLVVVAFERVEAVPDVLWGQLYKSQRSLSKLVRLNDFAVLRDTVWSDEKDLNVFLFEVENGQIPSVRKHLGPPLEKEDECERFVAKYVNDSNVASGPYIDDGRWIVHVRRKYTDISGLLKEHLRDGGRTAGVAEKISQVLKKGFRVLTDKQVAEILGQSQKFATFLSVFLSGKPKWLETAQRQRD